MKKRLVCIMMTLMMVFSYGCSDVKDAGTPESPTVDEGSTEQQAVTQEPVVEEYQNILSRYREAITEDMNMGDLIKNEVNELVSSTYCADPIQNVGYLIQDIDNDGQPELLIGSLSEDEFLNKMIFDLYSLREDGSVVHVIQSQARNRYYYVGEDLFANTGSSSAEDSFEATLKFENGAMTDMEYSTEASSYIQLDFIPFAEFEN